jgi:ubiquinone/menaquinone biosynthesis C-methylase UbiE
LDTERQQLNPRVVYKMSADPAHFAQAYWDTAAETYVHDFTGTGIGETRRRAVWRRLDKIFSPGQKLLELNCGTGIDAVHLAENGMQLVACDISSRMIELARQLAVSTNTSESIDFRVLPNEEIGSLKGENVFDGAFSNFCGLNCVEDLPAVVRELTRLVRPGAPVLLCMIGRFVPWEIAWFLAHGEPGKALRRLRGNSFHSSGPGAVRIQRPSVKEIARVMSPAFRLQRWSGVGIAVPPTYTENRMQHFPRTIKGLAGIDRMIEDLPLFRGMADCVVLEFESVKKGTP